MNERRRFPNSGKTASGGGLIVLKRVLYASTRYSLVAQLHLSFEVLRRWPIWPCRLTAARPSREQANPETRVTETSDAPLAQPAVCPALLEALGLTPEEDWKCLRRFLEASIKGFSIGAGLKGGLSLFSFLARLWSLGSRGVSARKAGEIKDPGVFMIAAKETLRYGMFLGAYAGTFVSVDELISAIWGRKRNKTLITVKMDCRVFREVCKFTFNPQKSCRHAASINIATPRLVMAITLALGIS